MKSAIRKSDVLIEALPYIRKFFDKVVVIKYGGAAVDESGIEKRILEDIMFMRYAGMHPVLVHGGGPFISKMMKKSGIEPRFIHGRRYTDARTVAIIHKALRTINRRIVAELKALGAKAVGLGGAENGFIRVRKMRLGYDLGYVGEVTSLKTSLIKRLTAANIIPVVYPLGLGRDGHIYNVNADDVACGIARALHAEKFVLLTNVPGVLKDKDDPSTLYHSLRLLEVTRLIEKGIIHGGMVPKVQACATVVKGGVRKAHILDADMPRALLLEMFTDKGIGTEIIR